MLIEYILVSNSAIHRLEFCSVADTFEAFDPNFAGCDVTDQEHFTSILVPLNFHQATIGGKVSRFSRPPKQILQLTRCSGSVDLSGELIRNAEHRFIEGNE